MAVDGERQEEDSGGADDGADEHESGLVDEIEA